MKNTIFPLIASVLILSSCQDKIIETYYVNEPQYLTYEDLRSSVSTDAPQEISQPGKIYLKDDYVFINEVYKGIHVINNANPSNPVEEAFISIPGNVDMAIIANILYADSYVDLVVLDIADLNNVTELNRVEDVFPYMVMPLEANNTYPVEQLDETKGVVTGWKAVKKDHEVENNPYDYREYYALEMTDGASINKLTVNGNGGGQSIVGIGGSMARFTINSHYLYTVDDTKLNVFDIVDITSPSEPTTVEIGWGIETIFPYDNKLFIGSTTGMFIYSLTNPALPTQTGQFAHVRSCDPVVVNGDYAYVTLRGGSACGGFDNQLDVLDVSDLTNPSLLKSYEMVGPYGLGIDDTTLFICDGDAGLKIYNASDPMKIDQNKLAQFSDINTYDVIPFNDILLLIGAGGLYQYDYSDLLNIELLSTINIYGD